MMGAPQSSPNASNQQNVAAVTLWEEAAPPAYRKIKLNGGLYCDLEPWEVARSDQEAEETCVDALTLQLRHQVTDIYVPLLRSDFALAVRRNLEGVAWSGDGELAPGDCPDLPFGNCWRSGLGASVHVVDRGESAPVYVNVTDEQGTIHRFVALFDGSRCVGYHPLPSAAHEQESGAMSLTRDAELNWVFRRKFGTTLIYSSREIVREAACAAGSRIKHRFYRLQSVTDPGGLRVQHIFGDGNDGVVPDEIAFLTRSIRVERNAAGYVSRLIDPRGIDTLLQYRDSMLTGGAPLLIAVERPALPGKRDRICYEYDEVVEPMVDRAVDRKAYHTNLCRITDANGHAYEFEYTFDRSRFEIADGVDRTAVGLPRCLSKTTLPGGFGNATFTNYSAIYANPTRASYRNTWVADAEGNGRIYQFLDPALITLSDLPYRRTGGASDEPVAPRMAVFRALQLTHCKGVRHRFIPRLAEVRPRWPSKVIARERYEFDVHAGMSLAKAIDLSGNVTQILYEDSRDDSRFAVLNPVHRKHSDLTARIDALGAVQRFKYEPVRRLLTEREDELGRVTTFRHDPETGVLLSEATYESRQAVMRNDPFVATEFEYEDLRFPAFVTRKLIRKLPRPWAMPDWEQDLVTEYEADELGEIAAETRDPSGLRRVTRFEYDASGNKLSTQWPDGYFVQFRYDGFGRLIRVYRPRQNAKRLYYDGYGNKVREVAHDGVVTVQEWDPLSRLVRSCTGVDAETRVRAEEPLRYNALNTLTFNPDVNGESRTLTVDPLQRLIKVKYGSGRVVRYTYGKNCGSFLFEGSPMDSTLAQPRGGSPTFWKRDVCGRKVEEFVLYGSPSRCEYDSVGNLIAEVDGSGRRTLHEYDPLNRRVKTTLPGGITRVTLYTSTGLEYESVNDQGNVVTKRYDTAGDLVEEER